MAKIIIAGAEYEVSEGVALAYTTAQRSDEAEQKLKLDAVETSKSTMEAQRDDLQVQLDASTGLVDELKAKVDSLTADLEAVNNQRSDSDVDTLVAARLSLINKVQTILDSEFDFAGKTDRQIQEAVITAVHGDSVKLEERTDAYVEARFDAVIELSEGADSSATLRQSVSAALRSDAACSMGTKKDARSQYMRDLEASWSNSSSTTKGAK